VLKLESTPDLGALGLAARRFGLRHPLLSARISRTWPLGIPSWHAEKHPPAEPLPLREHPAGTDIHALCENLLADRSVRNARLDLVHGNGDSTLIFTWAHLLFDGKGAELALLELSRLGDPAAPEPAPLTSWPIPSPSSGPLREQLRAARPYLDRYDELMAKPFRSLGGAGPRAGRPRFETIVFDRTESATIASRAEHLTGGIFNMPYFFAVTARAHAAVFAARGENPGGYYAGTPVQTRKKGSGGPIFQNHLSQLYFALSPEEIGSLESATRSIHSQFSSMSRARMDRAFSVTVNWMRRIPRRWYWRFMERGSRGHLVSFFHSHTGQFLPELRDFFGARIANGWHAPAVSQPPGTGVFFSERDGILTATLVWRDDSIDPGELGVLATQLKEDLLGPTEE